MVALIQQLDRWERQWKHCSAWLRRDAFHGFVLLFFVFVLAEPLSCFIHCQFFAAPSMSHADHTEHQHMATASDSSSACHLVMTAGHNLAPSLLDHTAVLLMQSLLSGLVLASFFLMISMVRFPQNRPACPLRPPILALP